MGTLPAYLKSGEIARLIPVIADTRREQRAASVFLSILSAVPDFAERLLASLGLRIGKRTTINSFTEVVFGNRSSDQNDRPDGLLIVDRGHSSWSALIEAKIGNAQIDQAQVERYLNLARTNAVDAVITISNQFVTRPDHSPIAVSKAFRKKTALYHWSWKFLLTEAILLQSKAAIRDPDQAFLLREFIRFLSHGSIGVSGFTQMPAAWRNIGTQLQSGASLSRNSKDVIEVVNGWHQEIRDLTLRMSHHLSVDVDIKLSRTHAADAAQRLKDDCESLADKNLLHAVLQVPDAAADIGIFADLKTRTIRVGMEIDAPQERKRTPARVNWLLRQLKETQPDNLFIRIIWPSRAKDTVCSLSDLREERPDFSADSSQAPRAFEVFYLTTDARRFSGRRTFIEELESAVPNFYRSVGQYLQAWRPKPPKPPEKADNQPDADAEDPESNKKGPESNKEKPDPAAQAADPQPLAGNRHTALLDIPPFLVRT